MKRIPKNLIKKAINIAVKRVKPKKVILFGSHAYGNPSKDSDVDLLFIKETRLSPLKRYCFISNNIEHIFPIDILVKTPLELKKRLAMGDPFYKDVIKRGIILYDSSK